MKQAKPRTTKQARLVVDADAAAEPHPVLPQPLRLVSRRALGPSRLLSLLTTWRTRMRSTISSQSELCLSRLVFSPRVIVLMFIRVYLGWARCLRAMTRKAARNPRSSHPWFALFLLVSGCCFLCRILASLFFFWLAGTLFSFFSSFFPFFFSITNTSPSPTYPLIYLARAD